MLNIKLRVASALMGFAILGTGCGVPAPGSNITQQASGDPYDVYRAEDTELLSYSQMALRVECLKEQGYPEFEALIGDGPSDQTRQRLSNSVGETLFQDAKDAAARGFGFPAEADPGSVVVHDPGFDATFVECNDKAWKALGAADKTLHSEYVGLANRLVTALMNGTGAAVGAATAKIGKCLVDQGKPVTINANSNWGVDFEIPLGSATRSEAEAWKPRQTNGVEVRPGHPATQYVPTAEESALAVSYYECSESSGARQDLGAELLKVKQAAVAKEEAALAELNPKIEELAKKAANLSA